ncbi:MAG: VWA domain-containing protein [Vicinamibacterales bacterium]
MTRLTSPVPAAVAVAAMLVACAVVSPAGQERPTGQGFSFKTGVDLINVTVTVTDEHGRFVQGLKADDFEVLENGQPQAISQFEAERVPVSLGIALDTSGSMVGEKIVAAQAALDRFLFDLLGRDDEVFLYRFDSRPDLVQGWTTDRRAVSRALGAVKPVGGTAIYDTLAAAVPLAQQGTRRKKAIVVISDGNDTSSRTNQADVSRLIRETEVLVYAIGIDASGTPNGTGAAAASRRTAGGSSGSSASGGSTAATRSRPVPKAFPGAPAYVPPSPPPSSSAAASSSASTFPGGSRRGSASNSERINADALRGITDDSGGRTEIIVSARDLDPATAGIASELSQQYFLGYVSSLPRDGKWHTIDVRVRGGRYTVRARRGYVAG